jgi:hypothetical protein
VEYLMGALPELAGVEDARHARRILNGLAGFARATGHEGYKVQGSQVENYRLPRLRPRKGDS